MKDKKQPHGKRYTAPEFHKLTASQVLSRLTQLAAARGRDLLGLVRDPGSVEVEENGLAIGQPWIGVDLDGTLAEYDGWKGMEHIGKPVPAMEQRVRRWLSLGKTVKIVTARVSRQAGNERAAAEVAIRRWAKKYLGCELPVTAEKDFDLLVLYDDRAVCVRKNKGTAMRWQDAGDFEADFVVEPPIDTRLFVKKEKEPTE